MGRRIFVDIETLPPDKADCLSGVNEDATGCSEEEYRRLALDGDFGRILTVGIIVEQDEQIIHRGLLGRERQTMMFHLDEARTLRGFWRLLKGFNVRHDQIVGHNLFDFDLPFLYKQSVIQRVRPAVELPFMRYRSQPIFDTMHQWNKWSPRKFVSLDRLAKVLGLKSSKSESIDGGRVYDKFCEGCPPRDSRLLHARRGARTGDLLPHELRRRRDYVKRRVPNPSSASRPNRIYRWTLLTVLSDEVRRPC